MRLLAPLAIAALIATSTFATAQNCSTLAVTGSGAPGTTLTLALTGGDPNTLAMVALGASTGSTQIGFGPLGSLSLGIAQPQGLIPLGRTDANGDATLSIKLPNATLPTLTLYGQAITATLQAGRPPQLAFCTSNVEMFMIG